MGKRNVIAEQLATFKEPTLNPIKSVAGKKNQTGRNIQINHKKHFGYSAKEMIRYQRFLKAIGLIQTIVSQNIKTDWFEIIDQCGYYDQSQLIRDFKHMRHLIIYAHPDPESLNGQLKQMLATFLRDNGHEVEIRDLYQLNFNPVLSLSDMQGQRKGQVANDVKKEQGFIVWADRITFIHPIWWTGLPAVVKGYIDRVFSYGFAYRYDGGVQKGLLTGKQAVIINTHGKSHAEYTATGMDKALSLTSDKGIYAYCGLEIIKHFFLDQADRATSGTIEQWESQIKGIF